MFHTHTTFTQKTNLYYNFHTQTGKAAPDYFHKAFAGVLNHLLCGIFSLKIFEHLSERSELCSKIFEFRKYSTEFSGS